MAKFRFTFYSAFTALVVLILSWLRTEDARAFADSWLLWYEPVLAGMICGILAALMGVYMLLNRIVFVSLSVAQGAGLGIFLAFLVAGFWGLHVEDSPVTLACGFIMASLTMFFFSRFRRARYLPDEVLIGLIYIFASGFIVLIGDRVPEGRHHIDNLLFGNAVAVTRGDLNLLGMITFVAIVLHFLFRREFVYSSVDPEFMQIRGLKTGHWQTLLHLTLTLSITISLKTLGSLPVFGMMIAPPYLALKNARGLREAFFVSLFLGLIIPPLGYFFSFLYSFPTGASIILMCLFYVVMGFMEAPFFSLMGAIFSKRHFTAKTTEW